MAMHLILTQEVEHLGDAGEVVRVKDGYARNYLLPRGLAMLATESRVKELEHKKRVVEERQRKQVSALQGVAGRLAKVSLSFERLAGEEGKLFGSVTSADIHEQLVAQGFDVERRRVTLGEPIKSIGEFDVAVRLHREVIPQIKVTVTAAAGSPSEDEDEELGAESEEESAGDDGFEGERERERERED